MHYLSNVEYRARLSPQELEFAQGFQEMMNNYYLESGLSTFPKALHGLDDQIGNLSMGMYSKANSISRTVVTPNVESSVICKVCENIGEVQLHEKYVLSLRAHI